MVEPDSRGPLNKISLALDGGHNILPATAHFLKAGGFLVEFEANGQLHVDYQDDPHIGSVTILRGPNVIDRLAERGSRHQFGIIGEENLKNAQLGGIRLEEVHPLGISLCEVVTLVPIGSDYQTPEELDGLKIATNLRYLTVDYYRQHGVRVKIVRYDGKQESAPDSGVADAVVATYHTGKSARDNHLRLLIPGKPILRSEAALVASTRFLEKRGGERIVQEFIAKIVEASKNPAALVIPEVVAPATDPVKGSGRWTSTIKGAFRAVGSVVTGAKSVTEAVNILTSLR